MQHTFTPIGLQTVVLRVILSFTVLNLQETKYFVHTALVLSGQASSKRAVSRRAYAFHCTPSLAGISPIHCAPPCSGPFHINILSVASPLFRRQAMASTDPA